MPLYFFFQAEDGIRDWSVTGVQTCALPIYPRIRALRPARRARSEDAQLADESVPGIDLVGHAQAHRAGPLARRAPARLREIGRCYTAVSVCARSSGQTQTRRNSVMRPIGSHSATRMSPR